MKKSSCSLFFCLNSRLENELKRPNKQESYRDLVRRDIDTIDKALPTLQYVSLIQILMLLIRC